VATVEEAKAQFQKSWDAWKAWAKLEERNWMMRLEQRGTVAFPCMGIAVMVILLITLFGHLF
jgi:hypothetical protein